MGQIRQYTHEPTVAPRPKSKVDCGWSSGDFGGVELLRLATYGSNTRKLKGKASQVIELDEAAARELIEIVERVFPSLR